MCAQAYRFLDINVLSVNFLAVQCNSCAPAFHRHVCILLSSSATSDGTRQGLESMRGGVCVTQGMKVVLKVGQSEYARLL